MTESNASSVDLRPPSRSWKRNPSLHYERRAISADLRLRGRQPRGKFQRGQPLEGDFDNLAWLLDAAYAIRLQHVQAPNPAEINHVHQFAELFEEGFPSPDRPRQASYACEESVSNWQ